MTLIHLLRGPLVVLMCVLGLAGCSGSDEATRHGAQAVEGSLEMHGFEVQVIFDRTRGAEPDGSVLGLLALFDDLENVEALVADSSSDGAIGSEVSAWVFDSVSHADSFQAGGHFRLQMQNVVVLTDEEHEAAARAALDDLNG